MGLFKGLSPIQRQVIIQAKNIMTNLPLTKYSNTFVNEINVNILIEIL